MASVTSHAFAAGDIDYINNLNLTRNDIGTLVTEANAKGTMSLQNASSVTITGGTLSNVTLNTSTVNVDDGASGSIFTTLQGFINKILSGIGSSIVGFTFPGQAATTVQEFLRGFQPSTTLEKHGAVGDGTTNDSAAWDAAVATGLPIKLGNKRYRIGSKSIQRSSGIVILGQQMPTYNSTRTALEGGSILLGSLLLDGDNIHCENFGVDNGNTYSNAYNGGLGGNAFVSHNIAQLGVLNKNNHFKNIIGLIRIGDYTDPQAAFHAVLLESLISGTAHNVVGVNGWYGVVLKVTDFNVGDVYGIENDSVSVQVKSNSYGAASRVNVANVITKNYSARGYVGFLIDASDAEASIINVANVSTQEGLTSVRILAEDVQPVVGVTIGNITSRDAGAGGIDVQGPCYGVSIGTATVWQPVGSGFSTSANGSSAHPVDVTIGTLRVCPSGTTTKSVDIQSNATKVVINTVNAAAADGQTLSAGSILNIQSNTSIGQYHGTLKGNNVSPALVNGWAAAFAQPTGLVVKSGVTRGYGRLSAGAATSDTFMTIPVGMRPDNLAFYTTMTAYQGGTGATIPITVSVDASGNASILPNRAYYAGTVSWYNLTDLCFSSEIPAVGSI